ncbi:type I-F CRISPR-associated protein Csy2 [Pseudomonas serbica]|uniref:type I-F CRISPR-associated protein Csy2 n=1 Tax=Pseudomonas serbica TaxID=2965074 RepID=UPI00237BC966|nr:type I-F CRISPR-associated protein Csy2 [Pseudomonas serbica]
MYFLTIPFTYSASNIRPNDMIAGMPSMSAVAGMAHNLQRVMQTELGYTTFSSLAFSLIYFNIDRDIGTPRRPPQEPSKGSMRMPGLMDIRRAHGQAALVVYFDVTDEHESNTLLNQLGESARVHALQHLLAGELRFAGGEVFIGTQGEFGNKSLTMFVEQDWSAVVSQLMTAYPTQGLLIQDMSHELSRAAQECGTSTLVALADLIYQSRLQREAKRQQSPRTESSAVMEACVSVDSTPLISEGLEDQPDEPCGLSEESTSLSTDPLLDDDALFDYDDFDLDAMTDEAIVENADTDAGQPYVGVLLPCAIGFHEVCQPRGDQHFVESVLSLVRARILPSVKLDLSQSRAAWQTHFWRWEYLPAHRLYRAVSFAQ